MVQTARQWGITVEDKKRHWKQVATGEAGMAGDYPPKQPKDFQYGNSTQFSDPDRGDAPPLPYAAPDSAGSSNKQVGCWIAGCLGSLFLGVMLIAAMGFGGYWWFTQQVEKYTDAEPAPMPAVEMEAEEVAKFQKRFNDFFKQAIPESGKDGGEATDGEKLPPPTELILTAEQINALIQSNETFADRAYVEIEDGRIQAKVTIPTDQIPGGAGRHFNADAEVEVSLQNGVLLIQIVDAKVKGESLPEEFVTELSKQNLAKELYDDANTAKMLHRFESIEVVDDTIRMRLKPTEKADKEKPASAKTTEETSPPQPMVDDPFEATGEPPAEQEPAAGQTELLEPAQ